MRDLFDTAPEEPSGKPASLTTVTAAASHHANDDAQTHAEVTPRADVADLSPDAALAAGFGRRIGALAHSLGAAPRSAQWAERAAVAMSEAMSRGHVCVSLRALVSGEYASGPLIGEAPPDGWSLASVSEALLASGVVCDGASEGVALSPLVLSSGGKSGRFLYLARYFDYERRLARGLLERAGPVTSSGPEGELRELDGLTELNALSARIHRFFGPAEPRVDGAPRPVDWQRVAAVLALQSRLIVVSGGPGTGKTTTVAGVLACLLDNEPGLRVALAAPTGKAAQRMQEALAKQASRFPAHLVSRLPGHAATLHRLLGGMPGGRFRFNRDAPLPYDVVIVDEASMIDLAMATRLFDALGRRTRLILLGDKDQLSAVEAGAVFAELSAEPRLSAGVRDRLAEVLDVPAQALDQRPDRDAVRVDAGGSESGNPGESNEPGEARQEGTAQAPAPLTDCVVWLERNYRFGLDSPVGRLSTAVRLGRADRALACLSTLDPARMTASPGAALDSSNTPDPAQTMASPTATPAASNTPDAALLIDTGKTLAAATLARLVSGFTPYIDALQRALSEPIAVIDPAPLFDALNAYRVLCAVREGGRGANVLNEAIAASVEQRIADTSDNRENTRVQAAQTTREGQGHVPDAGPLRGRARPLLFSSAPQWFAGRPVMVTRNDYALGLFNGDIGIALPDENGTLRVLFSQADGGYRSVSPAALPPHETAFAMTVHKSQGSEFDRAALILPATYAQILSRELIYTAITRARRQVEIIGGAAVLSEAIGAPTRRDSGLRRQLAQWAARRG
jgi:exodeoxyribonuclease V alpha subunit